AARRSRLGESLEAAIREGGGHVEVVLLGASEAASRDERAEQTVGFGEAFRCGACGLALERPEPMLFSFNHPVGACPDCKGFGNLLKYDESLVVPDRARTLANGAVEPWTHPSGKWYQRE